MFPSSQPMRKARTPKHPIAPNSLAPPVRPADRIDADLTSAIRTFLPSSHEMGDFPSLPPINTKTCKFRSDKRRVVSMPVFSQSPAWAENKLHEKRPQVAIFDKPDESKRGVKFAEEKLNLEIIAQPFLQEVGFRAQTRVVTDTAAHGKSPPQDLAPLPVLPEKICENPAVRESFLFSESNWPQPAVTQFGNSYDVAPSANGVSALDRLKALNPNACDKILLGYMRSSLESFLSASTMPSDVSSDALDEVFDCASSIYPSDDEMSQHDSLFDATVKSHPNNYPRASLPAATCGYPQTFQPFKPLMGQETLTTGSHRPFSFSLDICADYDKSRFMIPKENQIQIDKRRSLAQKPLPSVTLDHQKPLPKAARFSSGPVLRLKRLFSAH